MEELVSIETDFGKNDNDFGFFLKKDFILLLNVSILKYSVSIETETWF